MKEQGTFELGWFRTDQGVNHMKLRPEIIPRVYLVTCIVYM